jgi:hypothetical protein
MSISDLHYGIAVEQKEIVHEKINNIILTCSNKQLINLSKNSNDNLVLGIHDYYQRYSILSDKQKWCLARYIYQK